jgi:hypothetical protein
MRDLILSGIQLSEAEQEVMAQVLSDPAEEWRLPVGNADAVGRLLVSSLGRVAVFPLLPVNRVNSKRSGLRITSGTAQYRGHKEVTWAMDWDKKNSGGIPLRARSFVHQLVANAFLGLPENQDELGVSRLVVRHLNGDPSDNRAINLAWGTHAENTVDRLGAPNSHDVAPVGVWIGPSLARRIDAALSGELNWTHAPCCRK